MSTVNTYVSHIRYQFGKYEGTYEHEKHDSAYLPVLLGEF
jgi:hypothetical protein